MNIGFINDRNQLLVNDGQLDIYTPLLRIGYFYVKDIFDGFLLVYKEKNVSFEDLLRYFLKTNPLITNIGEIRFHKAFDSCICLLVTPFFDELCCYLEKNIHSIPKRKLTFLKKNVFQILASDTEKASIARPTPKSTLFRKNTAFHVITSHPLYS